MSRPTPSPARLALAQELRRVRSTAGLSNREMGRALGRRQATAWRIEQGLTLPARAQVEMWLDRCAAPGGERAQVWALFDAAHVEAPTWSRRLAGTAELQTEAAAREAGSALVRNVQPTIVPGLLQTESYARAVIPLADRTGEVDVEEAWRIRAQRQRRLTEAGRRFAFIIGERAWSWAPAPGVMDEQRARLVEVSRLPSVELALLLDMAPAVPWHNFVLHTPADGSPVYATAELLHGPAEVRDPADVAVYEAEWDRLWALSVGDGDLEAWLR